MAPNPDREQPEVLTGSKVLSDALNALDEALAAPITPENQQAWRTRVNGLKAQVMSIQREINSQNALIVERETQLAQESRRLRHESELVEARRLSLANTRPAGYASRIPADLPAQRLF